jgi:adenylate cyclase
MSTETNIPKLATNQPALGLGCVLVVDDEEQNRTLLRDPLEAFGYQVEDAENGLQALQMIAANPPDAILLDLMMPKMDGFEVCRRLKTDYKTKHIPILIITALSERGDRLLGIHAGANDFLTKPIDVQEVTLRVGNAVYAKRLYDQLKLEQEKSDQLLLNVLPKRIADRMKNGENNIVDSYSDVTVLVADLVEFTNLVAHIEPAQVVQLLNEIFSAFDILVEELGLEKIKTIGDAYMVAGGISKPRADHAEAAAELAFKMCEAVEQVNQEYGTTIRLRIGISSGPAIAGIIGRQRFAYDLWGEAVNLAFQLESSGQAGHIQIAEATHEKLKHKYPFGTKHTADVKGSNQVFAYWLSRR